MEDPNSLLENLKKYLANMTEEELEQMREDLEDKTPKGWISIEDHLPGLLCSDLEQGFSEFPVKYQDGTEDVSQVADGHTWYYRAKDAGITHWFNK